MTELIFIRHCESEMNLHRELIGGRSSNTPPTERGLRQAKLLGAYFREQAITPRAVFRSDSVRTRETARVALENAGIVLPVQVDDRLHELSQGEHDGQLRETVYTDETIKRNRLIDIDGALPGAESILSAQKRMQEFMIDTHRVHPNGNVLVFSHGLAIRSLVGSILGLTKQEILDAHTGNVSLTTIYVTDNLPTVQFVGKNVINE